MVGRSVTSRDLVLGRLRAALAGTPPDPVPVPRDYRRTADADLDQLAQRLTDYRAYVHRITEVAVADTIADILPAGGTVVVPPGLPSAWLPATVTALPDDGLDHARIGAADAVVTAAAVAVAQTGTVVLDGSPDQGRRVLSLLPDLHVCVVRADQVVATVPEALARLTPQRPLTWISGPSATSDIELIRVEGVHGPRRLHILLLP
ncbi:lactate utilization protein C [Micromonospora sp. NPDC051543]|uniref:lactate utilization protein C n=1 Tax=Micromonospora sp. NPDC051543 TaxID=3364287 RepID=UPI0037BB7AB2